LASSISCAACQPAHVGLVGQEDLEHQAEQAEGHRVDVGRSAHQQAQRLRHGRDVRGQVERVGQQQQADHGQQHPARETRPDVGGQAPPGDVSDARADDLDRDHERQGEDHRPQHGEAELRAGLGVGGDATGIVVGGTGDQAGPELAQTAPKAEWTDRFHGAPGPLGPEAAGARRGSWPGGPPRVNGPGRLPVGTIR
jgi:hypothetical protein